MTGTSSAWKALLKLRNNPLADIAMQDFAQKAQKSIEDAQTKFSLHHLPFITEDDKFISDEDIPFVIGARIARVSYINSGNPKTDITLGKLLLKNKHLSPFEHAAKWNKYPKSSALFTKDDKNNMYIGWENHRSNLEQE